MNTGYFIMWLKDNLAIDNSDLREAMVNNKKIASSLFGFDHRYYILWQEKTGTYKSGDEA